MGWPFPKWLMVAAVIEIFHAYDFELSSDLSAELRNELQRINNEFQWRVVVYLH